MTDGIQHGWELTTGILGTLIGLLPVLALIAAITIGAREIPHRIRVHRLQRAQRRSGRATRSS